MEEKFEKIKEWLGTASVNIFGLPMSGKDTVGMRLAEKLDGNSCHQELSSETMKRKKMII